MNTAVNLATKNQGRNTIYAPKKELALQILLLLISDETLCGLIVEHALKEAKRGCAFVMQSPESSLIVDLSTGLYIDATNCRFPFVEAWIGYLRE